MRGPQDSKQSFRGDFRGVRLQRPLHVRRRPLDDGRVVPLCYPQARESPIRADVAEEPQLLCDFGIYGDRAAGLLELDDQCRTVRFTLDFASRAVQLFEERWRRLLLFAVTFRELLDRKARGG